MKTLFIIVYFLAFFVRISAYEKEDLVVDFDASLGRGNTYLHRYYRQLMKLIDNNNDDNWFRYINQDISAPEMLNSLRKNYYRLSYLPGAPTASIPKVVHQIWVGDKPLPDKYKKWQTTWQSIPGWTYKLWTDNEVENLTLTNRTLYDKETNMGARSDILRLEILYREGGVYVDTDFECLKPELFDALSDAYDFYCCIHPLDYSVLLINNAIIGSAPGHPILKACIENVPCKQHECQNKNVNIVAKGSGLFSRMVIKNMNQGYRDMVFPPTYFYPLGARQLRENRFAKLPMTEDCFEVIKNSVVKPESIAIHWWRQAGLFKPRQR